MASDKKAYVRKALIAIGPGTVPNSKKSGMGYIANWGPQAFEGATKQEAQIKLINFLRERSAANPDFDNVYELPMPQGFDENNIFYIPAEVLEEPAGSQINWNLISED